MAIIVFIQDECIGTYREGNMVSEGVSVDDNALIVENVSKIFGGTASFRWPWRKHKDSTGEKKVDPNGGGPKRVVAVDNVTLRVRRHEIFGILGANGSGKSTLIRLVSTLLIPDTGRIIVFGHDVRREEMAVKRLINRVSVDAAFFKKLSPMENLIYAARLYGMDADTAQRKAVEILTRLGIEKNSIYRPLEDMSRGMQQKVAIARAFLTAPVLLLLDEPTTGLDPRSKRDVQEFVLNLRGAHDTTILLTTHDMAEADRLCDRIAILDRGKVVVQGTPAALRAGFSPNGHAVSMEDVFMHYTGRTVEDLQNEEG